VKHQIPITLAIVAFLVSGQVSFADSEYAKGVSSFAAKDYKTALVHIERAIKANPRDQNAIYYKAIISSQLGMKTQAEAAYASLIRNFPGTQAASNAEAALAYLNPRYLHQLKPESLPLPSTQTQLSPPNAIVNQRTPPIPDDDLASLPKQAKVYFQNEGKNLLIDASINGQPIQMFFDTGAETVAVGKNHLAQLGIKLPQSKPVGLAYGVGGGGAQAVWSLRVDLKVGNIERKNFPITVQEDMPTRPLLGQTFCQPFTCEVDNGAKSIRFTKKEDSETALHPDPNAIPFTFEGGEKIINVDVNGHTVPMIFDTGAEQNLFTADQARQAGLEIPEDAQMGYSAGIAGKQTSRSFVVQRMKCGPIIKNDVTVTVADTPPAPDSANSASSNGKTQQPGLRHPLLGQEFFGDIRYVVDNQACLIHMRR
jgi:predicted aspartyl protease